MRILIAEDEPENLEEIERILYSSGISIEVDGYINPLEALAAVERNPYDLALLDIMMPVMNGYEATKMIRSLDREDAKEIPIIAMTANAFEEDKRAAIAAGMNGHIAKPIQVDKLLSILAEMIRQQEN